MDNDPRHQALWTAVDYLREGLGDLRSEVRGQASKTRWVSLVPWVAFLVLNVVSMCTGRPVPMPSLPQAKAGQVR